MAVNGQHVQAAFGEGGPTGEVWTTYTTLPGQTPHAVVLAAEQTAAFPLDLSLLDLQLDPNRMPPMIGFEANTTDALKVFSWTSPSSVQLQPSGKWEFQVWAFAPWDHTGTGFALIGEQDKWVPVSNARFSDMQFSTTDTEHQASVTAQGTPGEVLMVTWAHGEDGNTVLKRLVVSCTVPSNGKVAIAVARSLDSKEFRTSCDGTVVQE